MEETTVLIPDVSHQLKSSSFRPPEFKFTSVPTIMCSVLKTGHVDITGSFYGLFNIKLLSLRSSLESESQIVFPCLSMPIVCLPFTMCTIIFPFYK